MQGKRNMAGRGGNGGEKPTQKKSYLLRRLWAYLSHNKWLLLLALVMTIVSNILSLIGPDLSGRAINALALGQGQVDFSTVFYNAKLMMIFYLTASVMRYCLSRIMIRLSRNVVQKMRQDVFDHLLKLPVSFFDKHQAGEVISTISYDIDTINASLSNDLIQVLVSIITVAGSFIMMLRICRPLVLVFVFTIPISLLFTRYMSRRVRPLYRKRSQTLSDLNGFVEETLSGHKTIKAYHQEQTEEERFDRLNEAATTANFQADFTASATGPSVSFINNLSLALVSVFGVLMYLRGDILLGNISSFVLYSRKFSGPINEFANILAELQSALAAAERVFRLLDEPVEKPDGENPVVLKHITGDVSFQHVRFSYMESVPLFRDLSFHAEPGSVTAIVGATGGGKTTIINLLMRFYDIQDGQILLDGVDIYSLRRSQLRGAFAMVLQDTWLFDGTVFENLAYGVGNVTLEQVKQAARDAHIDRFIEALPQGYDTVLSEGGGAISGGEKQLLTIARAMLMDAKMLILDEATSNVDTQTERAIHEAMLRLMKGRTCFIIAHRLSTIRHADNILVIQNGDVVEHGRHDELMKSRGKYYQLYHSQFEIS